MFFGAAFLPYVVHAAAKLSTDLEYFDRYVRGDHHPVYNFDAFEAWAPEAVRTVQRFGVDYVLVNPKYRDHVVALLDRVNRIAPAFEKQYDTDGFALFRVERSRLPSLASALGTPP